MRLQPVGQSDTACAELGPFVGINAVEVPDEIALLTLSFLTPEELGRSCLVSQAMESVSFYGGFMGESYKHAFPPVKANRSKGLGKIGKISLFKINNDEIKYT